MLTAPGFAGTAGGLFAYIGPGEDGVRGMTGDETTLLGREKELARLSELVAAPYREGRVLALLGEPGTGKTVLVAHAIRTARSVGMRVLTASGLESERDMAFAGLHQLLRPVLDQMDGLPTRQARALRGAFAMSEDAVPSDALLTGIAVLTLLAGVSERGPLLVVVDDVQWLDRASLDALTFVARRLEAERLVLILAARGNEPPAGWDRDFPEPMLLTPLAIADAGRLLDAQPRPPRGRVREQVLSQAAGNPLALIELSKVVAADPGAGRGWASEPLPLTGRLTAVLADRFTTLPQQTRTALLLASVVDNPELTAAVPGVTAAALGPAEAAGLIHMDESGPRFTHPLVRAAIYHAVPFSERAAAHLTIAEALRDQPDRHVWHLACATLEPDAKIAALLEESAARAQRRGGAAAAARALERAAELSPREDERARRLLAAADAAATAGQADWVRDLASRALTLTADPDLGIRARLSIGWSQLWSSRNSAALGTLLEVAAEAAASAPKAAWNATWMAATAAHQSGDPDACVKVMGALRTLEASTDPMPEQRPVDRVDEHRIWTRACTDPHGARAEIVPYLHRIAAGHVVDLGKLGAAAWILDETELAVRILREANTRLRAPGVSGRSGAVLSALQWACIDSGRWDDALDAAYEAGDIAAAYKMDPVAATTDLTIATIAAMRGDHEQVAPLLARAVTTVDAAVLRGFAARARHAAGLDALAQGSYLAAYEQLRELFGEDGRPLHYHFSYLAIADLAAAGVRAERRLEASVLLERALGLGLISPQPGPRMEQLIARARALLAERADVEALFAAPLADPAGATWPFERAQLQLDYGEWLRRVRRINDAKPVLTAALDTFRRLRATPWTQRAEAELRACGVTAQALPADRALDALTAQQREIVLLAGRGLTNSEIADRLFLSPRTVASHLYRAYPKLGVAGRHQLRDFIEQADSPFLAP
jgi:DNA-binding CsgD family transcriptional regulator